MELVGKSEIEKGKISRVRNYVKRMKKKGKTRFYDFEIMARFQVSDEDAEKIMRTLEAEGLVRERWIH